MFNVGAGELFVILAVTLVVLGPNRLPEAVRTAGKVMGEVRRITGGFQQELRNALEADEADGADDADELDGTDGTDGRRRRCGEARHTTLSAEVSADRVHGVV